MSKRRKGYPSETHVKRGVRVVHGGKELAEKVGRNDPCPCGSGTLFKKCCRNAGCFRRCEPGPLLSESDPHHGFSNLCNAPGESVMMPAAPAAINSFISSMSLVFVPQ